MCLSRSGDVFYIGCKDGTVWRFDAKQSAAKTALCIYDPKDQASAIRALCEWDSGELFVGKANGELKLLLFDGHSKWEKTTLRNPEKSPEEREDGGGNSVRSLRRLGDYLFVSQKDRSFLVKIESKSVAKRISEIKRRIQEGEGKSIQKNAPGTATTSADSPIPSVFLAQRIKTQDNHEEFVILVTELGDIYSWGPWKNNPQDSAPIRHSLTWAPGEHPAFINDYGIFRPDEHRQKDLAADGVFLATDSGVFFVSMSPGGQLEPPVRLSLPGLGAMCMALGYAQDSREIGYLWAIDSRGSCHLFCDDGNGNKSATGTGQIPNFRRTGFSHLDTQAVLAFAWTQQSDSEFLTLAYAKRDDQVGIYRYQRVKHRSIEKAGEVEDARRILSSAWSPNVNARAENLKEELLTLLFISETDRKEARRWPSYALLAELFEWLVEQPQGRETFEEFLSNPSHISAEAILWDLMEKESQEKEARESIQAIQVWTLSLLGIINRSIRENSERQALGVLRWYVKIRRSILAGQSEHTSQVAQEIEIASRMVKKWGIFGKISPNRQRLGRVIKSLVDQGEEKRSLDLLTYEATLFRRGVDFLNAEQDGKEEGRSAWGLQTIKLETNYILAVSWNWGGVEILELNSSANQTEFLFKGAIEPKSKPEDNIPYRPEFVLPQKARRQNLKDRPFDKYGYSRDIVLSQHQETLFLLLSPAFPRESTETERVYCWVRDQKGWLEKGSVSLPHGESVYSMLLLDRDTVLLGLRGAADARTTADQEKGQPSLMLVQVKDDFELRQQGNIVKIKSSILGAEATIENRVWSLTKSKKNSDKIYQVIVGCDGGEIWRITWPKHGTFCQECFDGGGYNSGIEGDPLTYNIEPVQRINSAVVALAYRDDYNQNGISSRVFAGGSNGLITAWQEQSDRHRSPNRSKFACLWSTVEQSPIAAFHLDTIPLRGGQHKEPNPILRAVTREGRMVVFDDRTHPPDVRSWSEDVSRPKRLPIPGCRHGRFHLGSVSFRSCQVELPSSSTFHKDTLVVATDHGTLRVLGLSAPHYTKERQTHLKRLATLWRKTHRGPHMLRLSDMAHAAAEDIQFLIVRALLWVEDAQGKPDPDEELLTIDTPRWCLPRHLRPLLDLAQSWDWEKPKPYEAGKALEASLQNARTLNDLRLFQEIAQLSLRRANFHLFSACQAKSDQQRIQLIQELYFSVFEAIERSLERWQGAQERAESKARMAIAKELVDGFTYYSILKAAGDEEIADNPFKKVLDKRILGVRQLILKRDHLLNLESLRAANLSLIRCLWLFCHERTSSKSRGVNKSTKNGAAKDIMGVTWNYLEPYLQHLLNGAVRGANHDDALRHEFSRTFALAISVCPSATIRIFNRLTETRLITDLNDPNDFSRRVERQLDILDSLGLGLPDRIRQLYRALSAVSRMPRDRERGMLGFFNTELRSKGHHELLHSLTPSWGKENAEDVYSLLKIDEICEHLEDLGNHLSTDASKIDLSSSFTGRLRELASQLVDSPTGDLYRQSSSFIKEALEEFRIIQPVEAGSNKRAPIRPDLVLQSRQLSSWSGKMLKRLAERFEALEIFEPEYTRFNETLRLVQRSSEAFPFSAAVQKEIVVGVLGHHLLEELDEHILEIEEIAQALDPICVRDFRSNGRVIPNSEAESPVAKKFAIYLLRRAISAESIPKNLRALHSLLSSGRFRQEFLDSGHPDEIPTQLKPDFGDLGELIADRYAGESAFDWKLPTHKKLGIKLKSYWEQLHLELALEELQQNHIKHSRLDEAKHRPRVQPIELTNASNSRDERVAEIVFKFCYTKDTENNLERLVTIHSEQIQNPTPPSSMERNIASSGTGLYLANLAASVVGWKLQIRQKPRRRGRYGECRFTLTKLIPD